MTIVCPFAALAFAATIAAQEPVTGAFLGSMRGGDKREWESGEQTDI